MHLPVDRLNQEQCQIEWQVVYLSLTIRYIDGTNMEKCAFNQQKNVINGMIDIF